MTTARTRPRSRRGQDDLAPDELAKLFERLPPQALQTERALLGSMILAGGGNVHLIGEVMQVIADEAELEKPSHQMLFKEIVQLYDRNRSIDSLQLIQSLKTRGVIDKVGGTDYIVGLADDIPIAENAPYYAKLVHDAAQRRMLIRAAGRILKHAYESDEQAEKLIDLAEREIFEVSQKRTSDKPEQLITLVQQAYEQLDKRHEDGTSLTGLDTGFFDLNNMLAGLQPSEMIIVAARPSMGKAQPLDAKVLTTCGWTTMGELCVGDELASVDGEPSVVTGVFPRGRRQVYRMLLSDGRSTECCAEHLWRVHHRGWDEPRVIDTAKLMSMLQRKRYRNRLWIETFAGEYGNAERLPLDPYLLGCLIGDGTLSGSSVRFSSKDEQTLQRVAQAIGDAMTLRPAGGCDYRIVQTAGASQPGTQGVVPDPIKHALEELGLWGCGATQKFIPPIYLRAPREARAALLAGLIDTDGWVESWGTVRLGSASVRLARDVVDLMRSLGGSGSVTRKQTTYTYRGETRNGLPAYVCNLQHADAVGLVRAAAKRDRLAPGRRRQRRLNIRAIEPTRIAETQCIAVSHPARLYITDDYIVTHNTAFALSVAEHIAFNNRQPIAVFSLEMSKQQLAERLLSARSGVDGQRMRRNMLNADEFRKLQEAVSQAYDAPMFIDDTPGISVLEMRTKARRLAVEQDIRCIVVDYMQLMSSPGAESRQQEVSEISRGIKALARELKVPIITLSQLNRNPEGRQDNKPLLSDLRESGSIEQDADVVMMLHREEYYHKDEQWALENPEKVGLTELIIAKQRNGPTGIVSLQFDSRTTRFHSRAPMSSGGYGAPAPPPVAEDDGSDPPF